MPFIHTRLSVSEDGLVSSSTPLPVGEHIVLVEIAGGPSRRGATEPLDDSPVVTFASNPAFIETIVGDLP